MQTTSKTSINGLKRNRTWASGRQHDLQYFLFFVRDFFLLWIAVLTVTSFLAFAPYILRDFLAYSTCPIGVASPPKGMGSRDLALFRPYSCVLLRRSARKRTTKNQFVLEEEMKSRSGTLVCFILISCRCNTPIGPHETDFLNASQDHKPVSHTNNQFKPIERLGIRSTCVGKGANCPRGAQRVGLKPQPRLSLIVHNLRLAAYSQIRTQSSQIPNKRSSL